MSIGGLDKVKVIANPDWCKKGNYFIMDVAKAGQIIGAPGFPELWDEEPCKIFVCHPDDEQAILAWMIVAELKDDCDGEFQMLDQDRVVHGLNALDAAVNGEERCIEPEEFMERRTMALARMREAEGE